jgi:hypothetical protein
MLVLVLVESVTPKELLQEKVEVVHFPLLQLLVWEEEKEPLLAWVEMAHFLLLALVQEKCLGR